MKLNIFYESASVLILLKEGLLNPFDSLMPSKIAKEIAKKKIYKDTTIPFPFVLAPGGKDNEEVLKKAKKGEVLELFLKDKKFGELCVEEIEEINPLERIEDIYGSRDISHPGVAQTYKNLGKYSVYGDFFIEKSELSDIKNIILQRKEKLKAKKTTAIMLSANPLHRVHELIIRQSLEEADLVVLFVLKHYFSKGDLDYDIRYESLNYFIDKYFPKNKVLALPLSIPYSYAGYNEIVLNALIASNLCCDKLLIGQNYSGLGMYYENNNSNTVLDTFKKIDIKIQVIQEYVYCSACKLILTARTCPHGDNYHIHYNSETILELLKEGILPPDILMRKDISALILSKLFSGRFKKLEKLNIDLFPNKGIIGELDEFSFYKKLMDLYQSSFL